MFKTSWRTSPGEFVLKSINLLFMIFIMIVTVYPFWYIFVASFSNPYSVVRTSGLMICFKGFYLYAYREVMRHRLFWISYRNTLVYLVSGLIVNMTMTTMAA